MIYSRIFFFFFMILCFFPFLNLPEIWRRYLTFPLEEIFKFTVVIFSLAGFFRPSLFSAIILGSTVLFVLEILINNNFYNFLFYLSRLKELTLQGALTFFFSGKIEISTPGLIPGYKEQYLSRVFDTQLFTSAFFLLFFLIIVLNLKYIGKNRYQLPIILTIVLSIFFLHIILQKDFKPSSWKILNVDEIDELYVHQALSEYYNEHPAKAFYWLYLTSFWQNDSKFLKQLDFFPEFMLSAFNYQRNSSPYAALFYTNFSDIKIFFPFVREEVLLKTHFYNDYLLKFKFVDPIFVAFAEGLLGIELLQESWLQGIFPENQEGSSEHLINKSRFYLKKSFFQVPFGNIFIFRQLTGA